MKKVFFIFFILSIISSSCKKDNTPVVVQADGVRIFITVKHHNIEIPFARLFVKKGTVNWPGFDTTLYDNRYVADAHGNFAITQIPNGQDAYTIYAKGIDASWDTTHATPVYGYQFVILDTHIGESKDYNVNIPVSE